MKTHSTIAGNHYTVTSPNGGTVTDASGKLNKVVASGDQLTVMAPSEALYCSDDDADIRTANFKNARLALRMLGAGSILPAGYKRLEYLEATGTQFIIVGANSTTSDSVEVTTRIQYSSIPTKKQAEGQNGNGYFFFGVTPDVWYGGCGGWGTTNDITPDLEWHNVRNVNSPADSALYLDDSIIYKGEHGVRIAGNLGIWSNVDGKADNMTNLRRANWRLKINDIVLYYLLPALDPTGAPCMFDLVSRTPFYNSGTGDFVTPQSGARTYSLRGRRVLPDWGKLTENGLRRLYHAPAWYKGDVYDYAIENGYKPIVEEPAPEEGYWVPVWHDREDCIELEWVETAPPAEELSTDK